MAAEWNTMLHLLETYTLLTTGQEEKLITGVALVKNGMT
jgi:hypothetical protein